MDPSTQRLLNDKLYDKRKQGALDLEKTIRDAVEAKDDDKIRRIVHTLCEDFAYAVHQPHARNGGLIGLAAAAIALGSDEVAPYLRALVPPVLACFVDQDARVRYYACESMYNISKVAKGEILIYFNDVFDSLCKLAADSEPSVKNGAELLDRLIKDIVAESAATYVSVLPAPQQGQASSPDSKSQDLEVATPEDPTAFSLAAFIPLLQERIHVLNPFTRMFLVSWVTLLDSVPDLELVHYLPAFLGGLFQFLNDANRDVRVITSGCLERFLDEIQRVAKVKSSPRDGKADGGGDLSKSVDSVVRGKGPSEAIDDSAHSASSHDSVASEDGRSEDDWTPGQDVEIDYPRILQILVNFLEPTSEEEIQLTALRWIDNFFDICPNDILAFVPRLLSHVLPAMANGANSVRQAANRVNTSLMDHIASMPIESAPEIDRSSPSAGVPPASARDSQTQPVPSQSKNASRGSRRPSTPTPASKVPSDVARMNIGDSNPSDVHSSAISPLDQSQPSKELGYTAAVNALTLHFLNEHEATRVAALAWLVMLQRIAPRKVLSTNDGTFPALLKTLSDPSEAVVTKDLQLLSRISKNSEEGYFMSFMVNLLQLFATDRQLLESRGNLIIRQLCIHLSAERIFRTLADFLEKDEDLEFASVMVQTLNNNLITAPELADLRKKLRNLETRDGQTLFVSLFRAWCHNSVATFSLCLLAQAYEQAYNLLLIFAELEMTVHMLIQIDKLVQLLESPIFTYLRLQLLDPERYPHLYKCLYGVLMLLPQSSAFAALKNRLNSVSAIGYLHIAPRPTSQTNAGNYDRSTRLKAKEEGQIKWIELLDKFRSVQDRARRAARPHSQHGYDDTINAPTHHAMMDHDNIDGRPTSGLGGSGYRSSNPTGPGVGANTINNVAPAPAQPAPPPGGPLHKSKSGLSHLGRFAGGVAGRHKSKKLT